MTASTILFLQLWIASLVLVGWLMLDNHILLGWVYIGGYSVGWVISTLSLHAKWARS